MNEDPRAREQHLEWAREMAKLTERKISESELSGLGKIPWFTAWELGYKSGVKDAQDKKVVRGIRNEA